MKYGFWQAAAIRAIKTCAQSAVALIGTNAMGVTEVNWLGVASGAALAGVLSLLTSIATDLPEAPMGGYVDGVDDD